MFRLPSFRSICVFTCTLLLAGLVALVLGGVGGGDRTAATQLASAKLNTTAGARTGPTVPGTPATTGGTAANSATGTSNPTGASSSAPASSPAGPSGTASGTPGTTATAGSSTTPSAAAGEPIMAPVSMNDVKPSTATPPSRGFHEFQVNCTITDHRPDDPIVFPGLPGASHNHSFFGNTTTDAASTLSSLQSGKSSCKVPADLTAYWMPTLYNGTKVVDPKGVIVYYKSDVIDYTSVRPFPKGLRFVAGSPTSTQAQFTHGFWSCGENRRISTIPMNCASGSRLFARYQAPSCWDGLHLDVADHKSHMAYPVKGRCPGDHPVALPMLEFKIPYPVNGDMSQVHLSSGAGFSFHYDFFNAWDDATLAALVKTCVNGGLQCNAQGYDQHHPNVPAALGSDYKLKS